MSPSSLRLPLFLAQTAVLLATLFQSVAWVAAAQPIVFRSAYAPGPADNPLKGFAPYASQGQDFPHSLEFNYLSLASMMTGRTNFNWAPMERLLDGIASAALKGRALEVSVTVTNRGVAPFYADWPVRIVAVGSDGGESVGKLPFALNQLLPATASTQCVTLDLAKFVPGEIKLLLGIPNPLKGGKPLRFANADT